MPHLSSKRTRSLEPPTRDVGVHNSFSAAYALISCTAHNVGLLRHVIVAVLLSSGQAPLLYAKDISGFLRKGGGWHWASPCGRRCRHSGRTVACTCAAECIRLACDLRFGVCHDVSYRSSAVLFLVENPFPSRYRRCGLCRAGDRRSTFIGDPRKAVLAYGQHIFPCSSNLQRCIRITCTPFS